MTGQILPRSGRDNADRPLALDAVDRAMLDVLRTDGRISMSNLAVAVNLSRAATYMRMNRLTDSGVIEHFSASINSVKAGLPIAALVLVTANHRGQLRWTRWREELSQIAAVEFAFMVTGDTDVVMLIRARDQDEFNWILLEQIQGLEHVGSTRTLLVINEILHRPYVAP